jgi:Domain of unknown function (DUF4349)
MGRINKTTAATLAVLVMIGVSACAGDPDSASTDATFTAEADDRASAGGTDENLGADVAEPPADDLADAQAAGTEGAPAASGSASPGADTPIDLDGFGRALAVEAGVVIGTPNIRTAVDDVLVVVQRNNASVFSADVNIGDELADGSVDGTGRIVVKVPPIDLYPLIADLGSTVGEVIGRTQNSEDVTEQLIDLDIRIRVEESAIAGFETLLAQAIEFGEIVEIQQTITEHTITLEQLLASQRNVDRRVDLSTLTIDLSYVTPVEVVDVVEERSDGDDGIADAFRSGWDAFAGAMFAVGLVVAVAAPFLVMLLIVAATVWLVARGRRAHCRHDVGRRSSPTALSDAAPADALVVPSGSAEPDCAEPNRSA